MQPAVQWQVKSALLVPELPGFEERFGSDAVNVDSELEASEQRGSVHPVLEITMSQSKQCCSSV